MKKYILYSGAILVLVFLASGSILLLNSRNLKEIPSLEVECTEAIAAQILDGKREVRKKASAENLGSLGMDYHANAFYAQAEVCYLLALEKDDTQWEWHYFLGYLALEMGQGEKVIEHFKRVLEKDPSQLLAHYYLGESYRKLRMNEEAEASFEQLRALDLQHKSGNPEMRMDHFPLRLYGEYQQAQLYLDQGRLEEAEQLLQQLLGSFRMYGPAYRLMGTLHRMRGQEALGQAYITRANDLVVYSPPVDPMVDRLALRSRHEGTLLKKIDEAINGIHSGWSLKLVGQAMEHIQDSKYLSSKAIKTMVWGGYTEEALKLTEMNLQLSLNDFDELYDMGMFFYQRERYEVALDYFHAAMALHPNELNLNLCSATAYWQTGRQEESMNRVNRILETNPENLDVLAEVTETLVFDMGEMKRSEDYYRILVQLLPEDRRVRKIYAWKAAREGRIQEAIAVYAGIIPEQPKDLDVILNLGGLYIGQEMWKEAITHFRAALVLNSNEPSILERLGTLLIVCPEASLRDPGQGSQYLERAFVHNSSSPLVKISSGRNLALSYAMTGDRDRALSIIDAVIKIARMENYPEARISELEQQKKQFEGIR